MRNKGAQRRRGSGFAWLRDRVWVAARSLWSRSPFAVGCGSSDDDGDGRQRGADRGRRGRGRAQPDLLGRLLRGRLDRPEGRLGHRLREGDRLPGQRQGRRHLRRDGEADGERRVRRRLGLGQCERTARRRRPRRSRQRRPGAELRDGVRGPQGSAVQHVRRHPLRNPARARGEPADVEHGDNVDADGRLLVGDPRPRGGVEVHGQDQRLRRPDLHRRRGALPEGAPARPRDRRIRTSSTRTSSTPRSTC